MSLARSSAAMSILPQVGAQPPPRRPLPLAAPPLPLALASPAALLAGVGRGRRPALSVGRPQSFFAASFAADAEGLALLVLAHQRDRVQRDLLALLDPFLDLDELVVGDAEVDLACARSRRA